MTGVDSLLAEGLVAPDEADGLRQVAERYAVALSPTVLALAKAKPDGPVALQFVPDVRELGTTPEERVDPIGDKVHAPVKGIVHRYPDRVLLKPLHACSVYCRFCFRREQTGPGGEALTDAELETALDYVRDRPAIWEVILTGGDPMILSARRLKRIVRALDGIPHVGVIRLHTRVPVVSPELVTPGRLAALKATDSAVYIAIHCNHADELTHEARRAVAALADAGIPLLGQSVLLRGVNDSVEALDTLFRAMVRLRIKPYYLHHPDLAPGTAHFRTSLGEGRALVGALRGRLSGIAQPMYVLDIPGGHGKVPAGPCYLQEFDDGTWSVTDPRGNSHAYPPKSP